MLCRLPDSLSHTSRSWLAKAVWRRPWGPLKGQYQASCMPEVNNRQPEPALTACPVGGIGDVNVTLTRLKLLAAVYMQQSSVG